jgi:hypothetical protein
LTNLAIVDMSGKHPTKQRTIVKKFTVVNKAAARSRAAPVAASTPVVAAKPLANYVVGVPTGINAAGLKPVCRTEIMSAPANVVFNATLGVLSSTFVADPSGSAANALTVDTWLQRFGGFQQYRVRSTRWIIVPLRTNVGTTTSSQQPGHIGFWIEDTPQIGAPTTTQFLQANRRYMLANQEKIEHLVYDTNEPQDLNLSDISTSPTHVVGSGVELGQHCLQLYGDDTHTGLADSGATNVLFTVTAVYDVEFFGIGGV